MSQTTMAIQEPNIRKVDLIPLGCFVMGIVIGYVISLIHRELRVVAELRCVLNSTIRLVHGRGG